LLNTLATSTNNIQTEGGLSLNTLAKLQLFRLARNTSDPPGQDRAWLDLVAQVICAPSALSAIVLEEVSNAAPTENRTASDLKSFNDWRRVWQFHEPARQLHDALGDQAIAWLKLDQEWLTYRLRHGPGELVVAVSTDTIQKMALALIQRAGSRTNAWEPGLTIAGRSFSVPSGPAPSPVAGSSISQSWSYHLTDVSSPLVNLQVRLAHPEVYFAQYRQRRLWFAWLIGISAIGAIVGLWSIWQAFQRQVRLAAMKSDFVSSVSHELRAPLAAIQLLVDSLERGIIRDEARRKQYHGLIGRECRRLGTLIENVLDFSRIERHRLNYEFEPTDVLSLVEDTVSVLTPHAQERQVNVVLQIDDPPNAGQHQEVSCDGKAIQQALVNLIDNAIKHSSAQGTVTVGMEIGESVREPAAKAGRGILTEPASSTPGSPARLAEDSSPCRADSGDPCLRLWVSDNGPGIPASDHERIFEPFFRRGSELRRETRGVGIGLSIVKHIVEAHHGRIQVQSQPGQGARFIIELPLQPPLELNRT
jgi:signal transduction histidine kinase